MLAADVLLSENEANKGTPESGKWRVRDGPANCGATQSGSFVPIHPRPTGFGNPSSEDSSADQGSKFLCFVESSSLTLQCLEFASEIELSASVSSSDYNLIYEGLQRVECYNPKKRRSRARRKSSRSGCTKNRGEKRGENGCRGRQVCNSAASYAGDCAAVSCCPCAILHLLILAFLVVPCVFARRAFCYVKRNARSNKKLQRHYETHGDDDDEKRIPCYYSPPWSFTQSPFMAGHDGSLGPKFDTHEVWWELYAAGHMGFGGLPFERD